MDDKPWNDFKDSAKTTGPAGAAGPWQDFSSSESPAPVQHKFGLGDTWPARLAKTIWGGITLPRDVYQGEVDPMSEEGLDRASALAGIANPVTELRGVTAGILSRSPTIPELKQAAVAGYESPTVKDVVMSSNLAPHLADEIKGNLTEIGVHPVLAPKTHAILDDLYNIPEESFMTVDNFRSLQRTLGKAAGSIDATERLAAKSAKAHVDEFLANLPEEYTLAGDPKTASEIISTANANYAAMKRASELDIKRVRAELRASATNSGMNVGNTIRQRMADILTTPKLARGFSPEELAQMKSVVEGSTIGNASRHMSNILGGGGGLLAGLYGLGHAAWAPIAGYMLRRASNADTMRLAAKLNEAVRARSPLAGETRFGPTNPGNALPGTVSKITVHPAVGGIPARAEDEESRRDGGRIAKPPQEGTQGYAHGGKVGGRVAQRKARVAAILAKHNGGAVA